MKWLVVVAGSGLVVWGAYLHWTGWLIVQVERGWSSVIAGAVFLAAGAVLLALAAFMSRIDQLVRAVSETGAGARPQRAPSPAPAPAAKPDAKPAVEPDGDRAQREAPSLVGRRPAPAEENPGRPGGWLQRAVHEQSAARGASGPPALAETLAPPPAPPRITRRYESQGVQYTLYDDGSIDAEANGSRHHFPSIAELREHIERNRKP